MLVHRPCSHFIARREGEKGGMGTNARWRHCEPLRLTVAQRASPGFGRTCLAHTLALSDAFTTASLPLLSRRIEYKKRVGIASIFKKTKTKRNKAQQATLFSTFKCRLECFSSLSTQRASLNTIVLYSLLVTVWIPNSSAWLDLLC